MPQVTVFIRNADLPRWKAISKKSEFMHTVLSGGTLPTSGDNIKKLITPMTNVTSTPDDIKYEPLEDTA